MKNSHVLPIEERLKNGRLCRVCWNCNDHEVEDNPEKTHTRIRCPECGTLSEWHKTAWVEFSHEDNGDGTMTETKTDQDGNVTVRKVGKADNPSFGKLL